MSILITGMEMPKSCDECRIMMFEDTNCAPELYCGCPIVFKAHPQGVGKRPDYCPLIELTSHGRLIDADALIASIKRQTGFLKTMGDDLATIAEVLEKGFQQEIENAPTIIEADEP